MSNAADGADSALDHWFAIVLSADIDRALQIFHAAGWTPAIGIYVATIRSGAHQEALSLRRARISEIHQREPGEFDQKVP